MELISDLVENYISKDKELLELVKNELGDLATYDPNYLLIAQDILYQVINQERQINYWVFQFNLD